MQNENISDLIQSMAAQRQSGALEAPNPTFSATDRGAQLERLSPLAEAQVKGIRHRQAKRAYETGGIPDPLNPTSTPAPQNIAVLPSETDAINAERTARWAMQDAASQAHYAREAPSGLDDALQAYAKQFGDNPNLLKELRSRLKFGFSEGGKIDAEALMRQMSAKYGAPAAGPKPAPAPAPAPQQPAPQPAPQQSGQGIVGIMRNRGNVIDKASGYARGGKIKGPGTATSDSIPAKVKETGENILVANGERILSVKQDQLLHRIALERGFDSVDAMLEHGTGEPVGPSIKAGKKAAAMGMSPGEDDIKYQNTPTPTAGPGAMLAQGYGAVLKQLSPFQDSDARLAANRAELDTTGQTQAPHPLSVPANRAAAPAPVTPAADPVLPPDAAKLTTRDIAPGGYYDRGAGIVASRNASGQLNVTNVGTEGFADRAAPVVDGSASAKIDQQGSTYNPQAQLERMQRSRLMGDLMNPEITDPRVRQQAMQNLAMMDQGSQARAVDAGAQLHHVQADSAAQLAGLQGRLLDPNTSPADQERIAKLLATVGGHVQQPASLQIHDVEVPIDPKQPLLGNRKVPHVFDPRTGQFRPAQQQQAAQPADVTAQAQAAIARGADRSAVNARLRSLGLPEVK